MFFRFFPPQQYLEQSLLSVMRFHSKKVGCKILFWVLLFEGQLRGMCVRSRGNCQEMKCCFCLLISQIAASSPQHHVLKHPALISYYNLNLCTLVEIICGTRCDGVIYFMCSKPSVI